MKYNIDVIIKLSCLYLFVGLLSSCGDSGSDSDTPTCTYNNNFHTSRVGDYCIISRC